MANETLARRYACAVFSLAQERDGVERIGADLAQISTVIGERGPIHEFFVAPIVDRAEKEKALLAAFGGRVDDVALHTLLLLVRKRRETLLGTLVLEYRKLQMAARGAAPLTVASARQLSADELRTVVERLERTYGKSFDVTQVVDAQLIGGLRIQMGDRRIDGTVAGRLEALTRTLFAQAAP